MTTIERPRPRTRVLGLALAASVLGLGSCGDDLVVPTEPETQRACARAISRGYWEDGGQHNLGLRRHVCLCMTEEEYLSQSRLEELHQALLDDCLSEASSFGMDWSECQADYESEVWISGVEKGSRVTWPTPDHVVVTPPGMHLDCP
ncbi:hypothetical protein [Plesiocystis pacifica]|uniref:hypothetical protein n=1 Tax=Plesiocystis pacifica TaxID=191768 RepID=UPI0012FAA876|nr:hypothetical protein [Plesiocystis pacifica]